MKVLMTTISLLLLFSSGSYAGVLIEPYGGTNVDSEGNGKVNVPGDTLRTTHKIDGETYGARLGYTKGLVMLGVDYSRQSSKLEYKSQGLTGGKSNIDKNQWGVFVGIDMPVLLRFWATYFVKATIEGKDSDGNDGYIMRGEATKGKGFAWAASYTGLPFLALNVEMRNLKYDKHTPNSRTVMGELADTKEILLSVSLPINL